MDLRIGYMKNVNVKIRKSAFVRELLNFLAGIISFSAGGLCEVTIILTSNY